MNYKVTPRSIGLDTGKAELAAEEMNQYLANLQVMFIKIHNLHWNVVGISFFNIHEKTQMLYEKVGEGIDLIATNTDVHRVIESGQGELLKG
ncbi:hypothetical protein EEL31_08425 [Brevibacillus laterosporus]|nr:hypothetical protein [Brevibacillus laterosporus]TPG68541.1 hypothetical protein EEL31_08425 [Brevibacillus laterosporus]